MLTFAQGQKHGEKVRMGDDQEKEESRKNEIWQSNAHPNTVDCK